METRYMEQTMTSSTASGMSSWVAVPLAPRARVALSPSSSIRTPFGELLSDLLLLGLEKYGERLIFLQGRLMDYLDCDVFGKLWRADRRAHGRMSLGPLGLRGFLLNGWAGPSTPRAWPW